MFWLVRPIVQQIISTVAQNAGIVSQVTQTIRGFVPKVTGSWKGGDEKAFEQAVMTQLVPAMVALHLAILGINVSFNKTMDRTDQADAKAKQIAEKLRGTYSQI